jgi:N-acetylglucosamine malate deacetylase 1
MNNAIIAIGAHPDDIELGCGATLKKLAVQGTSIFTITLCNGDKGNNSHTDRLQESSLSLNSLGTTKNFFLDFKDTRLELDLDNIITSLEKILFNISEKYNVTKIYTMYENDRHQDHQTTYKASIIAFRSIKQIICYETPSSGVDFNPKIFEDIDESLLISKINAIKFHKSQNHRAYMSETYLRSIATFRGQQAGYALCEAFVPYKMVL